MRLRAGKDLEAAAALVIFRDGTSNEDSGGQESVESNGKRPQSGGRRPSDTYLLGRSSQSRTLLPCKRSQVQVTTY